MTIEPRRIGFIGAGNMGEAMIGALIRAGLFPPTAIQASDVNADRIAHLQEAYGIRPAENNAALFHACDVVVLAVKPQQMDAVLSDIAETAGYEVAQPKLVISIAAGIPLRRIEGHLYPPIDTEGRKRLAMVRVMPNTPALVGAGMSGMSPNENAGEAQQAAAREILEAMGRVVVLPEAQLDAVTGVSGSGPAYVFYLAEAMAAGGVAAGLDAADAAELALATIEGAARLMRERGEAPASLRRKVTSPGGTTEAALEVLEDHEVGRHIADAVVAAARRAAELSG